MKKFFLIIAILFNSISSYSQCVPPPPPEGDCGCGHLMTWDNVNCEFITSTAYEDCVSTAGCLVPIDSNLFLLLSLAILLGAYSIQKKRRFET